MKEVPLEISIGGQQPKQDDFFFIKDDLESVLLSWEILRFLYNAFLLAVVLFVGWASLDDPKYWKEMLIHAFWLNLAFCAGPVGEILLAAFDFPRLAVRFELFGVGSLIAIVWMFMNVTLYNVPSF
jgi:hypothetical protein